MLRSAHYIGAKGGVVEKRNAELLSRNCAPWIQSANRRVTGTPWNELVFRSMPDVHHDYGYGSSCFSFKASESA
jgi:hypothetical protein